MDTLTIREKTTGPISMQLLANELPIDLTGAYSVKLEMKDKKNKTYRYSTTDDTPAIVITDAEDGEVTFTPPDKNVFQYLSSPYNFYFWVYIDEDRRYAVPEDRAASFVLLKEY